MWQWFVNRGLGRPGSTVHKTYINYRNGALEDSDQPAGRVFVKLKV